MKFRCRCGALIVDQTDDLPNKGHLLADQDCGALTDAPKASSTVAISAVRRISRAVYQCDACDRVFIDDPSRGLLAFSPDGIAQGGALGSMSGRDFPVALQAGWSDAGSSGGRGVLFWDQAGDRPGGYETLPDAAALTARYGEMKQRLLDEGRLRRARLTVNGETRDRWPD